MATTENAPKKTRLKTLIIEGTKYKTNLTPKFENRKVWEEPNPNKIYSAIPGTILKIYIKVGQKVNIGSKLLILEAMKMKNKVLSPVKGVVKEIVIKEGSLVSKNELLVEIE